jgi:hypothetical protein
MYVAYTITSHVHMLSAPLHFVYIHMMHHYNPRILEKVARSSLRLQDIG